MDGWMDGRTDGHGARRRRGREQGEEEGGDGEGRERGNENRIQNRLLRKDQEGGGRRLVEALDIQGLGGDDASGRTDLELPSLCPSIFTSYPLCHF